MTGSPATANFDAVGSTDRDRRVGRRLGEAMQVRLTPMQAAYLEERADDNRSSVSHELRACIDEAMVASLEARKRRQAEAQRAIRAIENGEADPADYPHLFRT